GGDTQQRSWQVLKPGGILVSTVGVQAPEVGTARGVRSASFMAQPNSAQLGEIGRLIDAGQVKVYLHAVLPLTEARKAEEISQSGHVQGKIVLQVVGDRETAHAIGRDLDRAVARERETAPTYAS